MGKGIVTAIQPGHDFVGLIRGIEGQGVDVGSQTGRGRGIDPRHMVVDAGLLRARFYTLLDQVHEIRGPEFAEAREAFCSGVDGEADVVILDDPAEILSELKSRGSDGGLTLAPQAQASRCSPQGVRKIIIRTDWQRCRGAAIAGLLCRQGKCANTAGCAMRFL